MSFLFGKKCSICKHRKHLVPLQTYCLDCEKTFRKCPICNYRSQGNRFVYFKDTGKEMCGPCAAQEITRQKQQQQANRSYSYSCNACDRGCSSSSSDSCDSCGPCGPTRLNYSPYRSQQDVDNIFNNFFGPTELRSNNNNNDIFRQTFGNNPSFSLFGDSQNNNQDSNVNSNYSYNDMFRSFFGYGFEEPRANTNAPPKPTAPPKEQKLILPEGEDIEAADDAREEDVCKICYDRMAITINLPCCHIFFCIQCAKQYGETNKDCPVCKKDMTAIKKTYK